MSGGHDEYTTLPAHPDCVSLFSTSQILDEIAEHGIRIYQLPDADSDEDEEFKEQTRVLKVRGTHTHTQLIQNYVRRFPLLVY